MAYSTALEGSKIVLNPDMKPRLVKKLVEYRRRLWEVRHAIDERAFLPPQERTDIIDAKMKIAVLGRLVRREVVNIFDLEQRLSQRRYWNPESFETACVVINAYNADAAGTLVHGTGLPEGDEKTS